MKKFLSLVLSVVLLLTLTLSVAAAGAEDAAVVCDEVVVEPGGQVEMGVYIKNNPGFMTLMVTPVIDPALTVVDTTNGTLLPDPVFAVNYVWVADVEAGSDNNDVRDDGLLMTFTFEVAEDTPYGDYAVDFIVRECKNEAGQDVAMSTVSGKVTVGKVQPTAIDQFEYDLEGNELIITAYIGEATKVIVGDTYEIEGTEYTVTTIEEEAFAESDVVKVTLPQTLTTIADNAFEATPLEKIVIPASVTTIGEEAFYKCESLMEAVVLNEDAEIGEHALGYYRQSTSKKYVLVEGFVLKGHPASSAYTYAGETGATFKNVLAMAGASVTLQHNLAMNYMVDKAVFKDYGFTAPYIVAQMNGETVTLSDYTVSGGYYVFSFRNIAPNQMKDTITATLHATFGGTEFTVAKDYSIAEYAYDKLAECVSAEYSALRTLLVDMLHYGAATQTYANYKTEALANAELTAEQLAWGTAADPEMESVLNTTYATVAAPTAKWTGAGLNLKDSVALRLQFTAASVDGLSVKIESNGQVWTIPASQFVAGEGNEYTVYFNGLHAGQMRQDVYLTIYNGETAVSNTARYSIGSYAFEMKDSGVAGLSALVKAMMKYGDSANAYAN